MEFENEERSDTISDVLQKCQRDSISWSPGEAISQNPLKLARIQKIASFVSILIQRV